MDADHIGTVDARTGYQTRSLMTVPLNTRQGTAAWRHPVRQQTGG